MPGDWAKGGLRTEREYPASDAPVEWGDGKFVLEGEVFQPFHYHDDDAQRLVELLGESSADSSV